MSPVTAPPPAPAAPAAPARARPRRKTSLFARGEPMVWLTGGALTLCLFLIAGLLLIVFWNGASTFWPGPVVRIETSDGTVLVGEVFRDEDYALPDEARDALSDDVRARALRLAAENDGESHRRLIQTGNFDTNETKHFFWVNDFDVESETRPDWVFVIERQKGGRFYGVPLRLTKDGKPVASGPEGVWEVFAENHDHVTDLRDERHGLERDDLGAIDDRRERARIEVLEARRDHGDDSPELREAKEEQSEVEREADREAKAIHARIDEIQRELDRYALVVRTAEGSEETEPLQDVVRAYPANQLGLLGRIGVYASRWWEFLSDEPREANSEGGVFPALFSTVLMTILMSIFVVPFGVLAALYLREYAKQGVIVSSVRIAINNLAGVPSIVFGVFGLGFFCYVIGVSIDGLFYEYESPKYGHGGLLWASLTLALLTLPVVIVTTEEALAAVPGSMREGSYACGASKWQTIRRIVLPRAMPGIMTGMILAMARGAGEVAPLMLVGAVKLAPALPLTLGDWSGTLGFLPTGPVHPDRSFMHLGFHIYDVGFQSEDSEAARPMVFTTTLLLITLVLVLNLAAIWVRSRLRRKFATDKF